VQPIEGHCHCGAVRWTLQKTPEFARTCSCTLCRRYGTLWAYGILNEDIQVSGDTRAYTHGDAAIAFHFCQTCGCVAYWLATTPDETARRAIAVNLRMTDPEPIADIPIDHFDGLHWTALPRDGRTVRDLWF